MADDGQPPAGSEHPRHLGGRRIPFTVLDAVLAGDQVEGLGRKLQGLDGGAADELHPASSLGQPGVLLHNDPGIDGCRVDRRDVRASARRGEVSGRQQRDRTVAGAQVQDPAALRHARELGRPEIRDLAVVVNGEIVGQGGQPARRPVFRPVLAHVRFRAGTLLPDRRVSHPSWSRAPGLGGHAHRRRGRKMIVQKRKGGPKSAFSRAWALIEASSVRTTACNGCRSDDRRRCTAGSRNHAGRGSPRRSGDTSHPR